MVYAWLIVTLLVLLVFFMMFKSQDFMFILSLIKKYSLLILGLGVVAFLVISFGHIKSSHDFDLTSFKGVVGAVKVYFTWFKGVLGNFGEVTGYAAKQDWFGNSTVK